MTHYSRRRPVCRVCRDRVPVVPVRARPPARRPSPWTSDDAARNARTHPWRRRPPTVRVTLPASGRTRRSLKARKSSSRSLPVLHEHLLAAPRLVLGIVQPHDHDPVQLVDLRLMEIVLGDGHVPLAHLSGLQARQTHVRCPMIGAAADQLRGGHAGRGKVQLVLDDLKEAGRLRRRRLVVGRHREDLPHPQVHPALAGADVADALQQLVEVVRHPGAWQPEGSSAARRP